MHLVEELYGEPARVDCMSKYPGRQMTVTHPLATKSDIAGVTVQYELRTSMPQSAYKIRRLNPR